MECKSMFNNQRYFIVLKVAKKMYYFINLYLTKCELYFINIVL